MANQLRSGVEPYLGVTISFYILDIYIQIATPQFRRDNHRPSLIPKWELIKFDDPFSITKMFSFNWFFHFDVMWKCNTDKRNAEEPRWVEVRKLWEDGNYQDANNLMWDIQNAEIGDY